MQLTIDDFIQRKSKLKVGDIPKSFGPHMEVIASDMDVLVLYDQKREKVYPIRFTDGRFATDGPP